MKALCSDDDIGLKAAFMQILNSDYNNKELQEKVKGTNPVICFWYKFQNFIKLIQQKIKNESIRKKCIGLFKTLESSRDSEVVKKSLYNLKQYNEIKHYIEQNVEPDLNNFCKANINFFTAGYNTSSIAESINRRLKRSLSGMACSLIELEDQSANNYRYMCGIKKRKAPKGEIVDIMTAFNVSLKIAESIEKSISKSKNIRIAETGSSLVAFVEEYNNLKVDNSQEFFIIHNNICNCHKFEQTGIPCCHIFALLKYQYQNIFQQELINP